MIFLDGKFLSDSKKLLRQLTPGFIPGTGVFESMKASKKEIYFLKAHLQRLKKGLKALAIRSPYSVLSLKQYLKAALAKKEYGHARIRLAVWKDKAQVHLAIVILPMAPLSQTKYQKGYRVKSISKSYVFRPGGSSIKPIRYESYLKAYSRAIHLGCDEALLINQGGEVAEGSRTNLFIIKKSRLITPRLKSGCLQGIIRQVILKEAKGWGIISSQVKVIEEDIEHCEEAFLTNSLMGIIPLIRFNGKNIGNGKIGPLTSKIRRHFMKIESRSKEFVE